VSSCSRSSGRDRRTGAVDRFACRPGRIAATGAEAATRQWQHPLRCDQRSRCGADAASGRLSCSPSAPRSFRPGRIRPRRAFPVRVDLVAARDWRHESAFLRVGGSVRWQTVGGVPANPAEAVHLFDGPINRSMSGRQPTAACRGWRIGMCSWPPPDLPDGPSSSRRADPCRRSRRARAADDLLPRNSRLSIYRLLSRPEDEEGPMAKVVTELTDDMDGSQAVATVTFGYQGGSTRST
jgi:hypothetical protein